jgi:hypothetical protein
MRRAGHGLRDAQPFSSANVMPASNIGKAGARLLDLRDDPELLLKAPATATLDTSDDLHPVARS